MPSDIEDYENLQATIRLFSELLKGEQSAKESGWLSLDEELENRVGLLNAEIKKHENRQTFSSHHVKKFHEEEIKNKNLILKIKQRGDRMRKAIFYVSLSCCEDKL